MSTTVSYKTEFECAYVQKEELHAHRYRIEVTVDGPQREADLGFVIDYRDLGKYVNMISLQGHFLVYEGEVSTYTLGMLMEQIGIPVIRFSKPIYVEMLCEYFSKELQRLLDCNEPGVRVVKTQLRETNEAFATYTP